MKQILIFAVKEDLLALLEVVESKGPLKYVRMGNYLSAEMEEGVGVFDKGANIPKLGEASAESSAACEAFLVCGVETPIQLRPVGANGERVCLDQLANPDSVEFKPGGIWNQHVVLYGRIATASGSELSKVLMKRFLAATKKTFSKVTHYYVGPKALALLKEGKRLTIAVQSPPDFDLIPPGKSP